MNDVHGLAGLDLRNAAAATPAKPYLATKSAYTEIWVFLYGKRF